MAKIDISGTPHSRAVFMLGLVVVLPLAVLCGCTQQQQNLPRPEVRDVRIHYTPLYKLASSGIARSTPIESGTQVGWIPSGGIEDRKRWQGIIVHHSATDAGNAVELNTLHKKRKDRNGDHWLGLGYHFVINNGRGGTDGLVEVGFRWQKQMTGAHCRPRATTHNYWNEHTIGICLVGNFERERPTQAQYDSLADLIRFLQHRYNIPSNMIRGHRDIAGAVTACPGRNFSWETLRQKLGNTMVATK